MSSAPSRLRALITRPLLTQRPAQWITPTICGPLPLPYYRFHAIPTGSIPHLPGHDVILHATRIIVTMARKRSKSYLSANIYSLDIKQRTGSGSDFPSREAGHCEYFASAGCGCARTVRHVSSMLYGGEYKARPALTRFVNSCSLVVEFTFRNLVGRLIPRAVSYAPKRSYRFYSSTAKITVSTRAALFKYVVGYDNRTALARYVHNIAVGCYGRMRSPAHHDRTLCSDNGRVVAFVGRLRLRFSSFFCRRSGRWPAWIGPSTAAVARCQCSFLRALIS